MRLKEMSRNKVNEFSNNFIENILSIKNTLDKKHKVITIAGMKIKIKRKKHAQSQMQAVNPSEYKGLKDDIIGFDTIKKYIDSSDIKVVSFDIFDTLLLRPVIDPTDIFYLIDAKLNKIHNINFLKYRLTAEDEMKNPYASLDDIYEFIQNKYKLDDSVINLMKQEELDCEKQLLFRRDDVFSLYQYALKQGKKIIAVSDMYLSRTFLKDVLNKNGYTEISDIYVSNENRARKDTGELYNIVLEKENILSSEVLHIGDNQESDYQKAIDNNILAIYFPSIKNILFQDNSIYNYVYDNDFNKDPISKIILGFAYNEYFKNLDILPNSAEVFPDFQALVKLWLAPFVFATSLSIANNDEIQENYSKILFSGRDGYLPQIGYDIVCQNLKNRLASKYVYAGRRAYLSTLEKDFVSYVAKRDYSKGYKLRNLLDLITNEDVKKEILSSVEPDFLDLELIKNKNKLISVLNPYKKLLNKWWTNDSKTVKMYYSKFISKSKREIVFDCGYSGSISKALSKIMDKPVDKIYLWQASRADEKVNKELGTKTYTLDGELSTIAPLHLIYEELFSPLEGGCIGFDTTGKPITEKLTFNKTMIEKYQIIEEETRQFIIKICDLLKPYIEYMNIKNLSIFNSILKFALTESPYCEADLLADIVFPDPVFETKNNSLQYKIENRIRYKTPFSQTGFENPEIKISTPNVLLDNSYKVGIHCHLYNVDLSQEIISYLKGFPQTFDLYLTICDESKKQLVERLFDKKIIQNLNKLTIIVTPNRGRDVAPWLIEMKKVQNEYDLFCHIHSKKSPYYGWGNSWRKYLYNNLIDGNAFINVCNIFYANPKLGILYPRVFPQLKEICENYNIKQIGEFNEERTINSLCRKMNIPNYSRANMLFSEGTMFWYRPNALKPLFDLNLQYEDFPEEPIGVGGTIAHAIERLPGFVVQNNGYEQKIYNYTMKDY